VLLTDRLPTVAAVVTALSLSDSPRNSQEALRSYLFQNIYSAWSAFIPLVIVLFRIGQKARGGGSALLSISPKTGQQFASNVVKVK
jgi:hypothetical protein